MPSRQAEGNIVELFQLGAHPFGELSEVPNDVDLWDCSPDHISAARRLWNHLYRFTAGVGWVRGNKLLARKRPRLIPVYDQVIRRQFGAPRPLWEPLSQALADQNLRERIDGLADGLDTHAATTLRLLDVANVDAAQ